MEDKIRVRLESRGHTFISLSEIKDKNDYNVTYKCKCRRQEISKIWSLAKGISDCNICLSEIKQHAFDNNLKNIAREKGFGNIEIIHTENDANDQKKIKPKVKFICKCGSEDIVTSAKFSNAEFIGCTDCSKKSLLAKKGIRTVKEIATEIAEKRGFTELEIASVRNNNKTRNIITFTCSCKNNKRVVKFESFKLPTFGGCKDCSKKSKSENIKKALSNEGVKEKRKQTNLQKYKTEYASQNEEVRNKMKQTNLEKYGSEYASSSPIVKAKISETAKINRSGETASPAYRAMYERKKDTTDNEIKIFIESLGYTYIKSIRDIDKSHILVDFICSCGNQKRSYYDIIKRKNFSGCIDCAGKIRVERTNASTHTPEADAKRIATNLRTRGVEYTLQDPFIKEKIRKTNKKLFGFENPSQAPEIHIKQHKFQTYVSGSGKEYKYQGFEHFAIKYLIEKRKIPEDDIETCHEMCTKDDMYAFCYRTADGEEHVYFPDLCIIDTDQKAKFIEVKSTSENYSKNLDLKMNSITSMGFEAILWRFDKEGNLVEEKKYK